ncbi:MAG: transglutaminase family protein [bacterium]|nr:transglutaminase family protein [bacterium]
MTIRIKLIHNTEYRFDRRVAMSPHVVRLRPAAHSRTPILGYGFKVYPEEHFINWQQDPFGNYLARLVFPEPTDRFRIEVEVIADLKVINPFDFFVDEEAEAYPFAYDDRLKKDLAPYLEIKDQGQKLLHWIEALQVKGHKKVPIVDFLVNINQKVYQDLSYNIRLEPGIQTCEETLTKHSGSCRDFAWLLVEVLRHLGLAARFVSGYLVQLKTDEKSLDGPSGPEADFTDLHAWCEVYLPGAGWVGLDPTSGLFAGEGHIPLSATPDPQSAAAITGATDPCEVDFSFENKVIRIHEDPRITKPYDEATWARIDQLGYQVDHVLEQEDVRLTIGGEPTFVSVDDYEAAQWNTDADGKHKRQLSNDLLIRLKEQWAPGALLQFGQGKWYPGEPLPRWKKACYWRKDGLPLWQDPSLQALDTEELNYGRKQARKFAKALSQAIQVPDSFWIDAFEDVVYFAWEEGRVPTNLDPRKAGLKDPLERRKLAELLMDDLGQEAALVMPLKWNREFSCFQSSKWKFRTEQLFLVPGNSAAGFRLPLDRLALTEEEKKQIEAERSLFEEVPPLLENPADYLKTPQVDLWTETIQTAMTLEVREGRLFLFLPPFKDLEPFAAMVRLVEQASKETGIKVILEGYDPPPDRRIEKFMITPDPGVIEVNVHPSRSWGELVDKTKSLYEQARLARLGSEKYMLDGRPTGTGGGNHVTLGGATPADSPLLRRPDLLRSLITYWQHHPGLSYLFSGLFVGPTSQAPRVDEGRDAILFELELAFSQLPKGNVSQPWLVDRILRNLLVDISGNTHRAEFCIDKLYSPDSPTGRLGLLEFRGYEMPPHYQMNLTQLLLIRTLLAHFWQKPYEGQLVRWGTQLHDKFMLPHYIWEDMKEVTQDLQRAGFPFQLEWLAPFLEFRFPLYGRVQVGEVKMELTMGIEPWNVLGEEVTSQGTARFVDSSVERLQVKLFGFIPERFQLQCNGRPVPMVSTGTEGEYVAGIRHLAWNPPSALHPNIPVEPKLTFDLVDLRNKTILGGCNYFVTHPGGRSYEVFPVNSFEAESRRINRFWDFGHTPEQLVAAVPQMPAGPGKIKSGNYVEPKAFDPNPVEIKPPVRNAEYPYTLDLRLR